MKEFCIHVYIDRDIDKEEKLYWNMCWLLQDNCSVFSDSTDCTHTVYGWGKHTDAIKVYSALKNNGYKIIYTEGV